MKKQETTNEGLSNADAMNCGAHSGIVNIMHVMNVPLKAPLLSECLTVTAEK